MKPVKINEPAELNTAGRPAEELKSGKIQGASIDEAFEQAQRAVDAVQGE